MHDRSPRLAVLLAIVAALLTASWCGACLRGPCEPGPATASPPALEDHCAGAKNPAREPASPAPSGDLDCCIAVLAALEPLATAERAHTAVVAFPLPAATAATAIGAEPREARAEEAPKRGRAVPRPLQAWLATWLL